MKKIFLISTILFSLAAICWNWQKPPVEYIVINKYNSEITYWDSDQNKEIKCGSIQEAMNRLSYSGYRLQEVTQSSCLDGITLKFYETIIMSR